MVFAAILMLGAAEPVTVIRNVTVYDGTGAPGVLTTVVITGEKISDLAPKVELPAGATVIDGTGLVACPGFIDLHTHCDGSGGITSKAGRPNKNYVTQGVTTIVTGNCGSGPVDAAKFFGQCEAGGIGTNLIHQVPQGSLRDQVMGNVNRTPTAEEMEKMQALAEKAMKDGAWGMATGLIYTPGTYSKQDEIAEVAKVVGKHGGHYASHIRNESGGLLGAIEEAIAIGKAANCPVHISHIKASGKAAFGTSAAAVGLIEKARAAGQTVTADQYPYTASSTSLRAILVPTKYREGSTRDFVARLDDPATGPKIRADLIDALKERNDGKNIQIARYSPKPAWQGKRISDIAAAEKLEPVDVVLTIERNGGAGAVNFAMHEEDVRLYMRSPWVATASDGSVQHPGDTVPHPRSYGTFPRKVGFYSLEEKLIPVETAIRSCSGLPAEILKLTDRGTLKPGNFADVLVFDPKTYRDTATYDKPHQYASGVKYVFVNGKAVIADGKHDPAVLAGKVLRHKSP